MVFSLQSIDNQQLISKRRKAAKKTGCFSDVILMLKNDLRQESVSVGACECMSPNRHTKHPCFPKEEGGDGIITTRPISFATHRSPLPRCLTDSYAKAWLGGGEGDGISDIRNHLS